MQPFVYLRQDDLAGASTDTRFLAGGTTLIDLMKLNVEKPREVIDLSALDRPDMHEIAQTDHGVRIGALVTMADAAEHQLIGVNYPVIVQSLKLAASQQ